MENFVSTWNRIYIKATENGSLWCPLPVVAGILGSINHKYSVGFTKYIWVALEVSAINIDIYPNIIIKKIDI